MGLVTAGLLVLLTCLFGFATSGSASAAGVGPSAAGTSCPTDYTGSTVSCAPTTTAPGVKTHLIISAKKINDHLVEVSWEACIIPAQGAGTTVQLLIGGSPYTGVGGSGTILSNGSGCTTDPNFETCLPTGTYSAQGEFAGGAYPETNLASFTVPTGVTCAAATITPTGTSTTTSSGGLAFTGANVLRALLVGMILILVGLVVTYIARERRRTRS